MRSDDCTTGRAYGDNNARHEYPRRAIGTAGNNVFPAICHHMSRPAAPRLRRPRTAPGHVVCRADTKTSTMAVFFI